MALLRDFIKRVSEQVYFRELKHLRFQIIFFAGLVLLPLLCGFGRPATFAALAGNLLYVKGLGPVVWILLLSLISSWTGMVMVFIVLDLGPKRFDPPIPKQPGTDEDRIRGRWRRLFFFGSPALAPAIGMLISSPPLGAALGLVAMGLALAIPVALLALWLATVIYYAVLPDGAPDVNLLLPESTVPRRFCRSMVSRLLPERPKFIDIIRRPLFCGYFDDNGILYAQHLVMAVLNSLVAVIYLCVVVTGLFYLKKEAWSPDMPAFSYLEVGWLLVGTIVTGLAFFFDGPITVVGFHIPVLILVGLFIFFNSSLGNFYQLIESVPPTGAPLKADDAIDALFPSSNGKDQILTIVCASGGGIQASAWAAQVLTGLDKHFGQAFTNSIGLISSVSGGSVGSMYYLDHRFRHNNTALQTDEVLKEAEVPSLAAALWGLVGPDTFRFLTYALPIRYSKIDRGWALEQVWRGAPRSIDPPDPAASPIDENFSNWRDALAKGKLPAVVFNATNVETGYPLLIGTTEVPKHVETAGVSGHENVIQIGDGDGQYGYSDIAAATAARLSASFTYVSPVATAVCNDGRPCAVCNDGRKCSQAPCNSIYACDGGYYDNFGVWSAVNWLQEVLKTRRDRFTKIVFLEIWAFPFDVLGNPEQVNQIFAPASAILNVRTASQLVRNETEIQLLQDQYPKLIEHVTFKVPAAGPLTWMLSDRQVDQIGIEWRKACKGDAMKDLENMKIYQPASPANSDPCGLP